MGTSAQKWLDNSILTPILGIVAVCACIAIVAALIRHFLYEHNDNDTKTVSTRVMHVFGFVAVIGFLAGGGVGLSKVFEKSASISSINGSTGKSLLPEDLKEEKSKYDNLGDLLTDASKSSTSNKSRQERLKEEVTDQQAQTGDGNLSAYESEYFNAVNSGDLKSAKKYLSNIAKIAQKTQGTAGSSDTAKNAKKFFKAKTGLDVGIGDVDSLTIEKLKEKLNNNAAAVNL